MLGASRDMKVHGAGMLAILRMAVETRRTALVDLSLDLIQKLIAHGHLAGSVYNISHKRDPAAGRSGRKVSSKSPLALFLCLLLLPA